MPTHASRRRGACVALLLVASSLAAGCTRDDAIEKTPITVLPAGYVEGSLRFSADGWAWALVEAHGGGQRVVGPEGAGPVHSVCSRITFAPKGDRFVHWAREDEGEGPDDDLHILVADGREIPTGFVAPGEVSFSQDGGRWLAVGAMPSQAIGELGDIVLLVDGTEVTRRRDMTVPVFSPDGAQVAWLARTDDRVSLFIDGVERQGFEAPAHPCAAAAFQAAPRPDLPLRHVLRYLGDGSLLAMTRDADGWGVYHDGLRIASYVLSDLDRVDPDCAQAAVVAPRLHGTAARAAVAYWWERVAGEVPLWRVVRNGRPVDDVICAEPWRRHPPEVSADGRHVLYACATPPPPDGGPANFVVKDGIRWGPYQEIWGLAFTDDGAHATYGASSTAPARPWSLYVDGEARVTRLAAVWRPRVTEDGAVLAWEAKRADDDEAGGVFGLNGRVLGSFDDVLWGPEFRREGRVDWIVRRGRKVTRLSVPFTAAAPDARPRVVTIAGRDPR